MISAPRLPTPTAILFDWDNTLVDTWPMIHTALNMTLRYMQHPEWSIEKVRSEVKQSMRDSFPEMFGDRWEEAAAHYQQSYRSIHLDALRPITGAKAMLDALATHTTIGVVSNKKSDSLQREIAHLGWGDRFAVAIGAGDAARDKPHPDPALLALEKIAIAPTRSVWFVGDTTVDLDCANAAGLTAILYADHDPVIYTEHGHHFAAHVRDYDELLALLPEPVK
ncbi:MAG: hypothetical protein B7X02_01125 [Rhodospirillales bacterium 12-54-5]|nr:MAG: hypothetical protein B7X02_01125 [Rhodospirillales bacterium 12-54-5]